MELSEQECRDLLHAGVVGRVAFAGADGIEILPVNYQIFEGHLVFATSPSGTLAQLAQPGVEVAFEVDHIADVYQQGWSVVVNGRTVAREKPLTLEEINRSLAPGLHPWAGEDRDLMIEIEAERLSGRRVRLRPSEPRP